jgi:hypothetical protein
MAVLKPQFPHLSILHNSDGSSCIIGFSNEGTELENKPNQVYVSVFGLYDAPFSM